VRPIAEVYRQFVESAVRTGDQHLRTRPAGRPNALGRSARSPAEPKGVADAFAVSVRFL
jgi:hypothetical protein